MKGKYRCVGCGFVLEVVPTAAVQCRDCGSLYLQWVNYDAWRGQQTDDPTLNREASTPPATAEPGR